MPESPLRLSAHRSTDLQRLRYGRRLTGAELVDLNGVFVCRMFNRAIAGQSPPTHLSSDNDPLFRFDHWRANLRVLEVDAIKAVPCSHPFVERLISTIRREYLDHVPFWNSINLTRKLEEFGTDYNGHHAHRSLNATPAQEAGEPPPIGPNVCRRKHRLPGSQ